VSESPSFAIIVTAPWWILIRSQDVYAPHRETIKKRGKVAVVKRPAKKLVPKVWCFLKFSRFFKKSKQTSNAL